MRPTARRSWPTTRPPALKAALALYLLLLLAMTGKVFWTTPYGYCRPLAPLFVLLLVGDGARALSCGIAATALCALVDLRISVEIYNQVVRVLHAALSVLHLVMGR